jgi:O-antigen/teichoic acid export membrane protein
MPRPASAHDGAVKLILGATGIAGIAGYAVTWLVYRSAGPAPFAAFAVFWSALYLLVGGLSGVQQEISRATHVVSAQSSFVASRLRTFAIAGSVLVAGLVVASAPLWQGQVFPDDGWALVWPLAVGAGSYVLVAVLCGALYGVAQWRSIAILLAVDAVLRLVLVVLGTNLGFGAVALAWAVALPFGLTIALVWGAIRPGLVGRAELDVGYRALSWNIARTVAAAFSIAVLVSGFPLLLRLTGGGSGEALLGELIFTITLIRAPLIVTTMSLQSLLLVHFRENPARRRRSLLQIVAAIAASTAVLAALGWWLGPAVFAWASGHPTHIDGSLLAVFIVSAGAVAALSVSGAAILARGEHMTYLAGWLVAAVVTIVVIVVPGDFLLRVGAALVVGPLAGLVVHTWALVLPGASPRRDAAAA